MGRLEGKRVLITGTAGGQGAAALRLFCAEGARVAGCDVREGAAEAVAEECGDTAAGRTVDLADPAAARAWVEWAAGWLGGVDVVYNNAGTPVFAPLSEMTMEDWHSTITNELHTAFYTTSAAWPHLMRGGGAIVNTASVLGMVGASRLGGAAHCASKAALVGFTKGLAAEGAELGIRANAISPGFILTPGTEAIPAEMVEYATGQQMLRRPGRPEEVALLALYLSSDESAFVTGANYVIDGGWTAGAADGLPSGSFRQAPA
jgi:meso-butanediol dehydrogenase/(S,S)-butanediol dehydrogenase/diacetyl reductase